MGTCAITINGVGLEVAVGKTILEAAAQAGIDIPAFCYDPRLKPFGACRMCLVEVAGARGPVAACSTPIKGGMVITTNTAEIEDLRKTALEFMLAEHHGDCVAPCQLACPAGIDIQGFIALIADGKDAESLQLIKEQMPFPASCGRVCPRFCEVDCRRNVVDEPVGIMHLKRYVADIDLATGAPYLPATKPATGKSIGIVGGGPAGLTAAYYLSIAGHAVTVYEAYPQLGGMLRYAIPEYRLPKAVLDQEIATITALCEEVKCSTKLGVDITLDELKAKHDAVIIAVGAAASQMIGVTGEDLRGNYGGLEFLAQYAGGHGPAIGRRVAVVGGGNTAIDCARTALRLGADEVTIVYRRSKSEMPAHPEEIEGAEEEGVKFRFLANPVSCSCEAVLGQMAKLTCVEMALGEPDASGRRRPRPVPGSEFPMGVDTVIWATGQTLDAKGLDSLSKTRNGFIKADTVSRAGDDNVFATADCVTGPTTVVEAVGAAHKTAILVNAFLNGTAIELPAEPYNHTKGSLETVNRAEYEKMEKVARNQPALRDAHERAADFVEIDPGHSLDEAMAEVKRCLSCGCQDVFDCTLRKYATDYRVTQPEPLRLEPLPVSADHELVIRDPNKCILCGSCVRICSEIQGASALGLTLRGYKVVVQPTLGRPLADTPCESCHQCISACPTGALTAVVPLAKPGPFALKKTASVCPECSVGCELSLGTRANMLFAVGSPLDAKVNTGNLCKYGALIISRLSALERVSAPMVRSGGTLMPSTWDEALGQAGRQMAAIRESGSAGHDLAVYVSSRSTTEEAALAARFAAVALRGAAVTGLTPPVAAGIAAYDNRIATYADLEDADLVLAFNADMAEQYPVAAIRIRSGVARGATRFISVADKAAKLDRQASPALVLANRSQVGAFLHAMIGYAAGQGQDAAPAKLTQDDLNAIKAIRESFDLSAASKEIGLTPEGFAELAGSYLRARTPVIVVSLDDLSVEDVKNVALLAAFAGDNGMGSKVLGLTRMGNARGLATAGIGTVAYDSPLHELISDLGASLEAGGFGGLVIAGAQATAATSGAQPFVLCVAPYVTDEIKQQATVVLPGSTLFEVNGSLINSEGRTQQVKRAINPPAGRTNSQILAQLVVRLGHSAEEFESSIAGPNS